MSHNEENCLRAMETDDAEDYHMDVSVSQRRELPEGNGNTTVMPH